MPPFIPPTPIAMGPVVVIAFLAMIYAFAFPAVDYILTPVYEIKDYICGLPSEQEESYLQPALEEILKTPLGEIPGANQKFIYTIDGKELLCTYCLDNSWGSGTYIFFNYNDSDFFDRPPMEKGIITDYNDNEVARKINVEIQAHNPATEEEDFYHIKRTYAAVWQGEWYVLTPFKTFANEYHPIWLEQKEAIVAENKKKRDLEEEQKKAEEDAQIRRVPSEQ